MAISGEAARNRAAKVFVFAVPLALAFLFFPSLETPFSTIKSGVLVLTATVAVALRLCASEKVDVQFSGKPRWFWVAVIALVSSLALSTANSEWAYLAWPKLVMVAAGIALMWGVARFGNEAGEALLAGIAVSAVAVAGLALAQFAFGFDLLGWFGRPTLAEGRMRVYATLGNPNFVAAWLAASAPAVMAWRWSSPERLGRAVRAFCVGVIVAGAFVTGSRGGLLALGAGLAVYACLQAGRRRASAVVVVVAALALAALIPAALNERKMETALRGRITLWRISLAGRQARSAFGAGPNTFAFLYPERVGTAIGEGVAHAQELSAPERHAHNDLVEYWSECGWVGALALVAVFGTWTAFAFRSMTGSVNQAERGGVAIAGVVAILVSACFDFPLHRGETWALLWLWMALPMAEMTVASARQSRWRLARWAFAVLLVMVAGVSCYRSIGASWWCAEGLRDESTGFLWLAERDYERAIALDISSQTAQFNLARVMAKQERYAEAAAQLERSLKYVNEPESWLLMARIEERREDAAAARKAVESGMSRFPYSEALAAELMKLTDESLASTTGVR